MLNLSVNSGVDFNAESNLFLIKVVTEDQRFGRTIKWPSSG